ncbi:DNA repair protein RadC [uncultured Arcticibacterium sp.]|uniref:RadC family protein n=1 Tax=uncultured Arcticibacterium sp. TaxID=2173042 RepID=UPI0030F730EE
MTHNERISISYWAEEDRPREKLLLKGRGALSDSELIAILIGSGSRDKSAVELSRDILAYYKNDINLLAKASIKELTSFKGIGEAKAISIVAALELGRRRKPESTEVVAKIDSPAKAYNYFKPFLMDLHHEEFWILLLDRSLKPIKHFKIGQGGVAMVMADPKLVFKHAIDHLATSIILCHNHPSGKKVPSHADIQLTKKLQNGAVLLDMLIYDHIIFTDNGFYSFSNEDKLK